MIALEWDTARLAGDIALAGGGGIAQDDTLRTQVLLSLFLDRRARADDRLPDPASGDRRGWVGDALSPVAGDRFGSRLWLLARETQSEETRRRAEEYAREALSWLLDDGLATAVRVRAEWVATGLLGLRVEIETAEESFAETFGLRV